MQAVAISCSLVQSLAISYSGSPRNPAGHLREIARVFEGSRHTRKEFSCEVLMRTLQANFMSSIVLNILQLAE